MNIFLLHLSVVYIYIFSNEQIFLLTLLQIMNHFYDKQYLITNTISVHEH